ncbi:MAG: hypothetical protein QOF70_39 [Acetobacteraceae bacterium]|nr:hypothetical protein [Acetobacteraceae bacterium]
MPFQTVNPATGELIRTFNDISDDNLELVLKAAQYKHTPTTWAFVP